MAIRIDLDFRSGIPIYVQIMDQIKRRVLAGELRPGDQLPTVRQLATDLRVNFNTVARAYRLLDEAGLISTQQGRGTYILEAPTPEVSEHLRQQAMEALTHRFLRGAARLGFSPDEVRLAVERHLRDRNPAVDDGEDDE
jgi:GntR family transcriptional regulator